MKEVPEELATNRYVKYVTAHTAIAAARNMKTDIVSPRATRKAVVKAMAMHSKVPTRTVQLMSDANNRVPAMANTQMSKTVQERARASSSFGMNSSIRTARG